MINYSVLENLTKDCLDLLNATEGLGLDAKALKANEKILKSLRRITIANEMEGKNIICIAGLQGAGKTTLIKNFYDIGEEGLPIRLGVGEKLPVLICERKDLTSPERYAVCLTRKVEEKKYERERISMNSREFELAAQGKDDGDANRTIMYLELLLPYRHFQNESSAFLLLPGYENKSDYWSSLIDFSIACAQTAVFVLDKTTLAWKRNQDILKQIRKQFGKHLIYVIGRCDMEKEDGIREVRQTCMEKMEIPQGEEDRVVCVGAYPDREQNEQWGKKLKATIEKYCSSEKDAKERGKKYIYDTIKDDIEPVLFDVKDLIEDAAAGKIALNLANDKLLEAFDKIIKERRKKLEKCLEKELKQSCEESKKKLSNLAVAQKNPWVDVRRAIFGENIEDLQHAREMLENAMKDDTGRYRFQKAIFDAVCEDARLTIDEKIGNKDKEGTRSLLDDRQGDVVNPCGQKSRNQKIVEDMRTLLAPAQEGQSFQLQYPNPADTMKMIAEVGAQYFCLSVVQESAKKVDWLSVPEGLNGALQMDPKELADKIGAVDKVVLGALGITGIDFMDDGVVNAIPAIAGALGVSPGIVAGTVATIVGVVFGVAFVRDINRLQKAEQTAAESAVDAIHDRLGKEYLNSFDDAMQQIRERIEENLITAKGLNKMPFWEYNALVAINKIDTDLGSIKQEVQSERFTLGTAFA